MGPSRRWRVGGLRGRRWSRCATLGLAVLIVASHPASATVPGTDAHPVVEDPGASVEREPEEPSGVANPGPFTATVTDVVLDVGTPRSPRPIRLDFPDCSSLEGCLAFAGEIDAGGNIAVPPDGVDVPTGRIPVDLADLVPGLVADLLVDLRLPEGLTGHLDPRSGLMTWEGALEIDLSDEVGILAVGCGVHGAHLAMSSEGFTSLPMPPYFPRGRAYDHGDGTVRLADNGLALPGASACGSLGSIDLDALIDGEVPLPAEAASFRLELQLEPVLLPAPVDPRDPSDPADPSDPSDPADPGDPSDPSDPGSPIPLPARFGDVAGSVHAANIRTLQLLGIVRGVSQDRFDPRGAVRRDQLASMLARMLQLEPLRDGPFSDLTDNVHAGAINALAAEGIALGTGRDGRFDPHAPVRRGQAAALIGRALQVDQVVAGLFPDVVGSTHEGWIDALAARDVIRGFTPDRFGPGESIRRDAAASMLARALPLVRTGADLG